MSYFIGIDVGTSATKSVLFDETGKIVFSNIYKWLEESYCHDSRSQPIPVDLRLDRLERTNESL